MDPVGMYYINRLGFRDLDCRTMVFPMTQMDLEAKCTHAHTLEMPSAPLLGPVIRDETVALK